MQQQWDYENILQLYDKPLLDLIYQAYTVHQRFFNTRKIEACALLSIKTGSCPEDCTYCSQSGHYKTTIEKNKLLDVNTVLEKAKRAKLKGAKRFCMGAAWRSPPEKNINDLTEIIRAVKNLGMETCMTLGMLDSEQAIKLKNAGLDYYNHNLDTSREYYPNIVSTRTYDDRVKTLDTIAKAGLKTCCGGIIGLGETKQDRVNLILELTKLNSTPESIPINNLIPVEGTPLAEVKKLEPLETVRTIATTRILFPKSKIRLSAGRELLSDEMHALCFMAGANSIFLGDTLLTAKNSEPSRDMHVLSKLGMKLEA